jgi:hypothetical protein
MAMRDIADAFNVSLALNKKIVAQAEARVTFHSLKGNTASAQRWRSFYLASKEMLDATQRVIDTAKAIQPEDE